jgi:CheY-like chemotaxis protein
MLTHKSNNMFFCPAAKYSLLSYNPETFKKLVIKIPDWNTKNIMIVEDDETNAFLLKAYLKKTKATIIEVRDGKKAVEICKSSLPIDLVLMDIRLPEMNGYNATKLIKTFRKELPIVAQTAYALKSDITCAFDAGCDDFLAKPITQEQLFKVLSKFFT